MSTARDEQVLHDVSPAPPWPRSPSGTTSRPKASGWSWPARVAVRFDRAHGQPSTGDIELFLITGHGGPDFDLAIDYSSGRCVSWPSAACARESLTARSRTAPEGRDLSAVNSGEATADDSTVVRMSRHHRAWA